MNRKKRFCFGFILTTLLFALPIIITITLSAFQWLTLFLGCYSFSVYLIYRMTIKNIRPKYPLVNPEGHPDIYSAKMPRPIYEDIEQYPWFFNKKRRHTRKATKKKNQ